MLLGLDIGTTSLKAVVYDPEHGRILRSAARPTPVQHPQPGWSEHDPEELWLALLQCIREAASGQPISALAISSMAEAGVLLDARWHPLSPIIAWFDRRSEAQAARIEQAVSLERLYRITGQRASPSFGLAKLLWIKDNLPDTFARGVHWLPVPAYLLWRLSGQMAVDYSIASRTLAYDQISHRWSTEILNLVHLPETLFPQAFPGATRIGTIRAEIAAETGLSEKVQCVLGGHDHLCAAFAAGAHTLGAVIESTGSANALTLLLPAFQDHPGLAERGYACYPHILKDMVVLKGGLKAAGSAIDWLARLVSGPDSALDYAHLERTAAEGIGRLAGPLWLPHLIGSGTPEGDRFSRAAAVGLQFEHTRSDLYRGMLESLAFWMRHNLEEMRSITGLVISSVSLTGGATRIRLLSRLKASVINCPVQVPQIPETAAVGAALLAGLGSGVFENPGQALASLRYECLNIDPEPTLVAWYNHLYHEAYLPLYAALAPVNRVLTRLSETKGAS
jgi:xylulokinase